MKRVELKNSNERLGFWFPVTLPVMVGLIPAFAEMVTGAGTSTGMATFAALVASADEYIVQLANNLMVDLSHLWDGLNKGVTSSMLAVDIWALTTLFLSRPEGQRSSHAYAYPIFGLMMHFTLVLIVVTCVSLSLSVAEVVAKAQDDEQKSNAVLWLYLLKTGGSLGMIGAVFVGWWVRRGVWMHYDSNLPHEPLVSEGGREINAAA